VRLLSCSSHHGSGSIAVHSSRCLFRRMWNLMRSSVFIFSGSESICVTLPLTILYWRLYGRYQRIYLRNVIPGGHLCTLGGQHNIAFSVRGRCQEYRIPIHYSRHISETVRLSTSLQQLIRVLCNPKRLEKEFLQSQIRNLQYNGRVFLSNS
jgi:hypothetical protein